MAVEPGDTSSKLQLTLLEGSGRAELQLIKKRVGKEWLRTIGDQLESGAEIAWATALLYAALAMACEFLKELIEGDD